MAVGLGRGCVLKYNIGMLSTLVRAHALVRDGGAWRGRVCAVGT